MVQYLTIDYPDEELLRSATIIHINSLSYRSFITQFGEEFLYQTYKLIVQSKNGFFVVAKINNEVIGFLCFVIDDKKIITNVLKNFYMLLPQIILNCLKDYRSLRTVFMSFLYFSKSKCAIDQELLIIAVKEEYRSGKIGSSMLDILENKLNSMGINQYKVTVHKEMVKAVNFYFNNGFKLENQFIMNNTVWYVLTKRIGLDTNLK